MQNTNRHTHTKGLATLGPLFLTTLLSSGVFAQDIAAAEALFREGKTLTKAGDFARACPKFAESLRLDPSAGTALNLAACHQSEGKTATAWADFLLAARIASQQGKPAIGKEATTRAAELEGQLSYLIVRAPGAISGTSITRDGTAMELGSLDTKIPVDPGPHVIQARATGYRNFETTVNVDGARQEKVVEIPALEPATSNPGAASAGGSSIPSPGGLNDPSNVGAGAGNAAAHDLTFGSRQPPQEQGGSSVTKTAGWILGGLGVVGLATGTVFGLRFNSKTSEADTICPTSQNCLQEEADAYDAAIADARRSRAIAFTGFGVGGAALVAGIVLLVLPQPIKTGFHVVPNVGVNMAGLAAHGTW